MSEDQQMCFQLEDAAYHLEQGRSLFEDLVKLSDKGLAGLVQMLDALPEHNLRQIVFERVGRRAWAH